MCRPELGWADWLPLLPACSPCFFPFSLQGGWSGTIDPRPRIRPGPVAGILYAKASPSTFRQHNEAGVIPVNPGTGGGREGCDSPVKLLFWITSRGSERR